MPPDSEREQFELICKPILETLKCETGQILTLLRGEGSNPGLVGDLRSLSEKTGELREVVFGSEPGTGLMHTVDKLALNGKSRKSAEKEKRTLLYGVLSKLATAAVIALAAWLLSLYRWGGPIPHRVETAQPATAETMGDIPERPPQ